MKKQTQEAWIVDQLLTKGTVSRNACLKRYITRLAMHIFNIKTMGYEIAGTTVKTKNGRDYQYTLIR